MLDTISWVAIMAGVALMACAVVLDWRLERVAPGRYHHHSGGAWFFAAMFWIGGLLRQPAPHMTTATAVLGVAGVLLLLLLLCGAMWWSDRDLIALHAPESAASAPDAG